MGKANIYILSVSDIKNKLEELIITCSVIDKTKTIILQVFENLNSRVL